MELRWILILAGVGIFAFLYFSGRPNKGRTPFDNVLGRGGKGRQPSDMRPADGNTDAQAYGNHAPDGYAAGAHPDAHPGSTAQMPSQYADHPGIQHDHHSAPPMPADNQYADSLAVEHGPAEYGDVDPLMEDPRQPPQSPHGAPPGYMADPYAAGAPHETSPGDHQLNAQNPSMGIDPGDMQRPADATQSYDQGPATYPGGYGDQHGYVGVEDQDPAMGYDMAPGVENQAPRAQQSGGLSNFLAQLSGGLLGRRGGANGKKGNGDALYSSNGVEPFLITLHVVAPDGQIIHGPRLQALFEQRGYHFGEMNIFHSLNQGSIVFSIAKMVEPGTFDQNDPASFETPGISMILQLPAPVVADVAFEVLISEAEELANVLGCSILDGDFSTLSQQTVQHMRDNVHQFMHRQRLAETVPS